MRSRLSWAGRTISKQALLNLTKRMKPRFIGVATTALMETRGEDIVGDLKLILERRPELRDVRVVLAKTPDFEGALEDGWSKAVSAIIDGIVEPRGTAVPLYQQINILPGVHQTAGDIEWMVETAESFGLIPVVLPDVSGSLDGTVPDHYIPTTFGGASVDAISRMGRALHTVAIGEHMRAPAELLAAKTGVPSTVFANVDRPRAIRRFCRFADKGLRAYRPCRACAASAASWSMRCWTGISILAANASRSRPIRICWRVLAGFFTTMGADIVTAVASTSNSPLLGSVPDGTRGYRRSSGF